MSEDIDLHNKTYKCPICKMKKPTSPLIHGLSIMKKYSRHGLQMHIIMHKKSRDKKLVEMWEKENGNIESCRYEG